MKTGSIPSAIFCFCCVAFIVQSATVLGTDYWGSSFIVVGVLVALGPYVQRLRPLAQAIAMLAAVMALIGIGFGLFAATMGGSFNLPVELALLLLVFGVAAVSGIVFSRCDFEVKPERS